MATITSLGVGSGLDVESIVTKLMDVEKKPLTALNTKEEGYQAKLTAYGTLKSTLATFQDSVKALSSSSKLRGTTATLANTSVATVFASSIAKAGSHSLEVEQLAQGQKLAADGQDSLTAAIGNGTITIDFGTITGDDFDAVTGKYTDATFASNNSGVKTIVIKDANNSLSGIRDAINSANIGVTASIVNDGGTHPYRLVLSSESGAAKSMKIGVSGSDKLSELLSHDPADNNGQSLSETETAKNAKFKVDGVAISKASNSVSDVITGVTLNLTGANKGNATTLTVTRDTASVEKAVNEFVTAYNDAIKAVDSATAYDRKTNTAAILNGESTVRTIKTQMRNVLNMSVSGGATIYSTLSQVGVSFQKNGTLAVDGTKLSSALKTNFDDFAGLFAATGTASDSLITYYNASGSTKPGAYAVNISQVATQGTAVSAAAISSRTISGNNDSLLVQLDGKTATISLTQKTYDDYDAIAAEIQSKINASSVFSAAGSSVTVSQLNGVLTIKSNNYGSSSSVRIIGGDGRTNLNFGSSATYSDGLDVAGTINGVAAKGAGQFLTAANGNDASGISILVSGGSTGSRGTVNYSQGFAYRLDKLLDNMLDDDNGIIASRTSGLTDAIKRLDDQEAVLSRRLDNIEARYRAQFASLDTLMSSMNTTSTYLQQQFSSLLDSSKN